MGRSKFWKKGLGLSPVKGSETEQDRRTAPTTKLFFLRDEYKKRGHNLIKLMGSNPDKGVFYRSENKHERRTVQRNFL
jgi:hypothetical protein